ncbi:bifunctional hydroxymethylpyrimidine kinase/phosphomethylpyrimidine kinase [Vibrio profundum]|uniref:bifunctional hydroxymethylpyrimidine kinase/phosphomethylpyrimidine kinase n=1 Tax=Vibrio profundum TaxID=2910247 RepID=UPI003D116146
MNDFGVYRSPPVVLTIAGSDSGGGAGIQADIKTISATGSYACSVITAITAQNTQGVSKVFPLPAEQVEAQLATVLSDLNVVAIKIGMLSDANIIQVVAKYLRKYTPAFSILDPVLVSTSGTPLLESSAVEALKAELIPYVDMITPNLPESAFLATGKQGSRDFDVVMLGTRLLQIGAKSVLLKGGHAENSNTSCDWLFDGAEALPFSTQRIITNNSHGTGCTLSSAIASYRAQGKSPVEAVAKAKEYIFQALRYADKLSVGQGRGPVNHFYAATQAYINE